MPTVLYHPQIRTQEMMVLNILIISTTLERTLQRMSTLTNRAENRHLKRTHPPFASSQSERRNAPISLNYAAIFRKYTHNDLPAICDVPDDTRPLMAVFLYRSYSEASIVSDHYRRMHKINVANRIAAIRTKEQKTRHVIQMQRSVIVR